MVLKWNICEFTNKNVTGFARRWSWQGYVLDECRANLWRIIRTVKPASRRCIWALQIANQCQPRAQNLICFALWPFSCRIMPPLAVVSLNKAAQNKHDQYACESLITSTATPARIHHRHSSCVAPLWRKILPLCWRCSTTWSNWEARTPVRCQTIMTVQNSSKS